MARDGTNATFQLFRDDGKYIDTTRGILPVSVFTPFYRAEQARDLILGANGGLCPGLTSSGTEMIWVVVPDRDLQYGWPIILDPRRRR